jgi:hypothetical protein
LRKLKAIRLAQWRLKQRLETIDYMEDDLQKEVNALLAGEPVLGLEGGVAFDIVIEHETPHPSKANDSGE